MEQFVKEFELPNRPVIITDLVPQWPAFKVVLYLGLLLIDAYMFLSLSLSHFHSSVSTSLFRTARSFLALYSTMKPSP